MLYTYLYPFLRYLLLYSFVSFFSFNLHISEFFLVFLFCSIKFVLKNAKNVKNYDTGSSKTNFKKSVIKNAERQVFQIEQIITF